MGSEIESQWRGLVVQKHRLLGFNLALIAFAAASRAAGNLGLFLDQLPRLLPQPVDIRFVETSSCLRPEIDQRQLMFPQGKGSLPMIKVHAVPTGRRQYPDVGHIARVESDFDRPFALANEGSKPRGPVA